MPKRRLSEGTGCLIVALLFFLSPFFVVFGGLVKADAPLWALVLVFYIVAGIWFSYGYKQLGEEEQRFLPILFFFVVLPFFIVLGWLKEVEDREIVGQQVSDERIKEAQDPLELLDLLEPTLNDLGPLDLNRVED